MRWNGLLMARRSLIGRFWRCGLRRVLMMLHRALVLLGRLANLLFVRLRSRGCGRCGRRGRGSRSCRLGGGGDAECRHRESQGNSEAEDGEERLLHGFFSLVCRSVLGGTTSGSIGVTPSSFKAFASIRIPCACFLLAQNRFALF